MKPVRRSEGSRAGDTTRHMGIGDLSSRRLERRWAPRYDFRVNLDIEWGSAMLRACTRDVSSNGMFIESVDPLWIGAGFSANLMLDHPVKVVCSVKRVEPGRGMGVSVSFPEQQQETYLQLISRLSRTLP